MRVTFRSTMLAFLIAFTAGAVHPQSNDADASSTTRFFRSNAIGLELEEIRRDAVEVHEYVLAVTRTREHELRVLTHDGTENRRTQVFFDDRGRPRSETVTRIGVEVISREFDAAGRITREEVSRPVDPETADANDAVVLESVTMYAYRDGRLVGATSLDADGELNSRDDYVYRADGSLRRIVRTHADGTERVSEFGVADGRVVEERHTVGSRYELARFDERGRVTVREQWVSDARVGRSTYSYHPGTETTAYVRDEDSEAGSVEERWYDEAGRLVEDRMTVGTVVVSSSTRAFDEHGRPERIATVTGTRTRIEQFEYDGDRLVRRELTEDGRPVVIEVALDDGSRREDRYREGVLVQRIFLDGDRRIREEVVRDGEIIRVREVQ